MNARVEQLQANVLGQRSDDADKQSNVDSDVDQNNDPSSDALASAEDKSNDSQEDPASTQLIKEQNAALGLSLSSLDAADRDTAAEGASLLNSARAIGSSAKIHQLPIRGTEQTITSTTHSGKLTSISRLPPSSQTSGRLRKPTQRTENLVKRQQPKRHPYDPPASPEKPKLVTKASKTLTTRRRAIRNTTRNDGDEQDEEQDTGASAIPPSSGRQQKNKRVTGAKMVVAPETLDNVEKQIVHEKGYAARLTGSKRSSDELGDESGTVELRSPKRARPTHPSHPQVVVTRASEKDYAITEHDDEALKAPPQKRGRPPKTAAAVKSSTTREISNKTAAAASKRAKSNRSVLNTEAQARAAARVRRRRKYRPFPEPEQAEEAMEEDVEEPVQDTDIAEGPAPVSSDSINGHAADINGEDDDDNYQPQEDGHPDVDDHDEYIAGEKEAIEDGDDDEIEDDDDDDDDGFDLLGERSRLQEIFILVKKERRRIPYATTTCKNISRACRAACKHFEEARISLAGDEDDEALGNTLIDIHDMIENLKDNTTKEPKLQLTQDIYARTIPSLVRVLEEALSYYKHVERLHQSGDELELSVDSLAKVTNLVSSILSLQTLVHTWGKKLDSSLGIVKPIRNKVIAPLKLVEKTFKRELQRQEQRKAEREASRKAIAQQQRAEKEYTRKREVAAKEAARQQRWYYLHLDRIECEPDITLHDRLRNKCVEDSEELDANGEPIERLSLLGERDGPRRPEATNMEGLDWTDEELEALIDGLRKYAGPRVFSRIFKKYCRPPGILRPFTAREITQQAAYVRRLLIRHREQEQEEVEQWILDIPVLQ
ncbi:hypothetical protein K432DRAFT_381792 [Lepidopterella palustris CBS 459.81]|uniref:Uncharacterized protein n=1 Tax=Lepidopterella palustris CBS 459.81 TaxID=1314670 RepID=A0A8E2EBH0_9PEZI|nr:hypothetical protein K432DRAFT_381792 [Lepidopterella palustris CBS 459.81]